MRKRLFKYSEVAALVAISLCTLSRFLIPCPSFDSVHSTVLESSNGSLLSARIASDGQWRFPPLDSVPDRFRTCLIHYEDRSFYAHLGIDPKAILRATKANCMAGRVVQGGSTLSMQVARMIGGRSERTFGKKAIEALLALHLENKLSKEDILNMYASNAPFGGNVVGLETASWRYYGRLPSQLSWAESAMLAVLPNAPSLIYPGKSQDRLRDKRDRLLLSLYQYGSISQEDYELSVLEPIPTAPEPMPMHAIHLMDRYSRHQIGERIKTRIDDALQRKAQKLVNTHVQGMESIEVYNAALVVLDTQTLDTLAYVGNSNYSKDHANAVDCVSSLRNSGSILKPIIYAKMLDAGELTPSLLLSDIPSRFSEYNPENYFGDYDGVVKANEALYRSLNIPFVHLLKDYGVGRFQKDLKDLGLTTLTKSPDHYGLSLMLGGAEVRLDELCGMYAKMGRCLSEEDESFPISPLAVHYTFKSLCELTRPEGRDFMKSFRSSKKVAWKTGTSYGNKDAWAVGVTPEYTIGVWVGNADGEGRTGLTGVRSAAPLLFDILDILPRTTWFIEPGGGREMELCTLSGRIPSNECSSTYKVFLPSSNHSELGNCKNHKRIYTADNGKFQARIGCSDGRELKAISWFVLPPIQEVFYKIKHPEYRPLPPMIEGCGNSEKQMEFIYPQPMQAIYIPLDLDGEKSRFICKLAHRDSEKDVHWYVDQVYLGSTVSIHEMPLLIGRGSHKLLVVDEDGEEEEISFRVLSE